MPLPSREIIFAVGSYALCSSCMLFFNKLSVSLTPEFGHNLLPGPISCMQLVFAVSFCGILHFSKAVNLSEAFNRDAFMHYCVYGVLFVGSVYASMKSLQYSNVETQIVFRAATPLTVCVLDYLFLGRELPGRKSSISLLVVAFGAVLYVATDSEFTLNGFGAYAWVGLYYILICMEMTLGKFLLSAVKLKDVWASVLLTNATALPLLFGLSYSRSEFDDFGLAVAEINPSQWIVLMAGCVTGTLIGWTGWNARSLVSATTYTLIGVANKFFTVLLSVVFLDKHASGPGIAALMLCIAASTQYEPAPLRKKSESSLHKAIGSSLKKLPSGGDGDDEEGDAYGKTNCQA